MLASGCNQISPLALCLCAAYLVSFTAGAEISNVDGPGDSYRPFNTLLKPYVDFVDDVFLYLQGKDSLNITESCQNDTRLLLNMAKSGDKQALKFLDATGRPDSGVLEGGVNFLGFYSECLRSHTWNESRQLSGKYCLVEISYVNASEKQTHLPQASWAVFTQSEKKPSFGFCIPSSCEAKDINLAVNQSSSNQFYSDAANISSCSEKRNFAGDPSAISATFFLTLIVTIALFATAYDVLYVSIKKETSQSSRAICEHEQPESPSKSSQEYVLSFPEQCLLCFSLTRNASRLLTVRSSSGNRNIDALHGIRFLTMFYIILLHTHSFAMKDLFFRNNEAFINFPKLLISQIFTNGTLSVDTFYFMSGLLVTYVTLRAMGQEKKLNIPYFIIHRVVRLTPLVVFIVTFCAGLLRYMGSGPNWSFSILMYDDWCRKNWWLTMTYLQNFVNTETMCLSHSWYLATDFQFYLVTPPILILLSRNAKYAYLLMAVYFIINVVVTFTLTLINNFPAVPYMNNEVPLDVVNQYYRQVYIKPYCRMGPYLVGILAGYFFIKKPEFHMKKVYVVLSWFVSTTAVLFVIFIMYGANVGHLPIPFWAALYSAFARTIWALGIFWVTLACTYGYGGLINDFLSWKALVPLSRLTYCAYLIHPVIMGIYNGCTETAIDFSRMNLLYIFLGNLVSTYSVSFVLTLLFESPFGALESTIRSRSAKRKS